MNCGKKSFGQLVTLGFDVAVFTPASYQREKGFQGGGDKLRAAGVNLHSLAIIESAEPGHIVFREEA